MVLIAGVDSVLGELDRLGSNPSLPSFLADLVKKLQLEFRFLKTFFWCFDKWDDARLGSSVTNIAVQLREAGRGLYAAGLIAIQRDQREKWDIVTSNLLEKVQQFKPQVAEICLDLLDCSFDCNFSTSYEILDFINAILDTLKHLVISKSIIPGHLEMKIIELEEILRFLRGFVEFAATRAIVYEKLDDFWNHVQGSINKASCASFLIWVDGMGEQITDSVFPDLWQKIEPFTPEVTEMYLGVLKASKSSPSDTTLVGEVVASFIDSLFKNLEVSGEDYIPVLREGLMFLIMFLMDPPEFCENLILTEIDAIVSDIASFICSSRVDQIRQPQNKFLHRELIQRIGNVKAKIKALFVQNSDSLLSDFPKINGLGFLNFLLEKIEEWLECDAGVNTFAKFQIVTIQRELMSLLSLLKLQNEHNKLGDIRMQIINVAYRAEHVIDTSLIMDAPIWYHMVNLSDVIEHMKLIKFDFQKLMDKQKMEAKQMEIPVLTDEIRSKIDLREEAEAEISCIHAVGLEDDKDRDMLELRYKHLPDFLKPCFLYFAAFQKGNLIKVKKLVQLWMAEGFIPKTEGKSLEDVANEYLMDLISRNLVIVSNRSFSGRIKECHLHNQLLDFCVIKGEEECFVKLLSTSQLYSKGVEHEQYRCCIHTEWSSFVNSKPTGRNVHSLLFHLCGSSNEYLNATDVFNGFKLLRVLDLEALRMGVVFLEELTSLIYLRYLAIIGDFTSIPTSIERLSCLESLFLHNCDSIIALPNIICKMKRLRHIGIPSGATVSWDDYDLEESILLHNVVTFSSLYVSCREDAELLVKMLPNVQRLRFQFYIHFPKLNVLHNLESLSMHKVGRAPYSDSLEFPSTVRELTLSNLRLRWQEISKIAKLPNLEALKLLLRSFEGLCWAMTNDEFLRLKFLKLEGLNITIWNGMDGSLPCLERLVVKNCVKLEEIPYSFGGLSTLKIIEVTECSSSVANSAKVIAKEQHELGNDDFRVTITTKVGEEPCYQSKKKFIAKEELENDDSRVTITTKVGEEACSQSTTKVIAREEHELGNDDRVTITTKVGKEARSRGKVVVLKLHLQDDNKKRKALKIVSTLAGIDQVSIDMKGDKMTVIGVVDPISLVTKLRKHWPTVEIISVGPAGKKEEAKKEEAKKEEAKREEPKSIFNRMLVLLNKLIFRG